MLTPCLTVKQINDNFYTGIGLTSHSTHYRSFWRQFYRSNDPANSVIALKDNG